MTDFNARNEILTGKILPQVYRYHKFRKNAYKILSSTPRFGFKIQGMIKISFATGPLAKVLWLVGWLFWLIGPLRQYFSLYRAVAQREEERGEKG